MKSFACRPCLDAPGSGVLSSFKANAQTLAQTGGRMSPIGD